MSTLPSTRSRSLMNHAQAATTSSKKISLTAAAAASTHPAPSALLNTELQTRNDAPELATTSFFQLADASNIQVLCESLSRHKVDVTCCYLSIVHYQANKPLDASNSQVFHQSQSRQRLLQAMSLLQQHELRVYPRVGQYGGAGTCTNEIEQNTPMILEQN